MQITEVRIKLADEAEREATGKLRGYASITFEDEFVVKDLRIIEGKSGLFVAMPSRKVTSHCPACRTKNHLRARFCNECGEALDYEQAPPVDVHGRAQLHADIAHPCRVPARERLQATVLFHYRAEVARAHAAHVAESAQPPDAPRRSA